jgi:hypothetical protein
MSKIENYFNLLYSLGEALYSGRKKNKYFNLYVSPKG